MMPDASYFRKKDKLACNADLPNSWMTDDKAQDKGVETNGT